MNVAGEAQATLAAPPHHVLFVLTDFAAYPQWWPGCVRADIVGGDPPASYEVAFGFDTRSPLGTIDVTLRLDIAADGTRIGLAALAGPITRLRGGGWTLSGRFGAGGVWTDVRYALAGEMDTGLPGFVERPFAARARGVLIDAPLAALAARIAAGVR